MSKMTRRMVEFVAGLRAAGVRVSVGESEDAARAVQRLGMLNRDAFREALRATLIKQATDEPTFERLFTLYFEDAALNMRNLLDKLSPAEQRLVYRAVRTLLEQLHYINPREQISRIDPPEELLGESLPPLLQAMLRGQMPDEADFAQAARQAEQLSTRPDPSVRRLQRQLIKQMGSPMLHDVRASLSDELRQQGLHQKQVDELMSGWEANMEQLSEEAGQYTQRRMAQQWAAKQSKRTQQAHQLMYQPLQKMSERDVILLRQQMRRVVAQLRSQIALRQKRAQRSQPDVRRTIRRNMRYGGMPLDLQFKTRMLKPRLLLLCDISNSMRKVVEFALRLVYELQDHVSSVRTFTYIDTLSEISHIFAQSPAEIAMQRASERLRPQHPNTDLGHCLSLLLRNQRQAVDRRTTVIIVGDACNSWNDPRLDMMLQLQRHSKAVIWLNPRPQSEWETQDCDMLKYLPYADVVHQVSTMADLSKAVDQFFARR